MIFSKLSNNTPSHIPNPNYSAHENTRQDLIHLLPNALKQGDSYRNSVRYFGELPHEVL